MPQRELNPSILLNVPLKYLSYVGMNPLNTRVYFKICSLLSTFFLAVQLALIISRCVLKKYENDGERLLDYMTIGGTYQQGIRPLLGVIHKQEICTFIQIIREKYNKTNFLNKEEYASIQTYYKYVDKAQKYYNYVGLFCVVVYLLSGIVDKKFLVNFWPETLQEYLLTSPYFPLAWSFQAIYVVTGIYVFFEHDVLLFTFILLSVVELNVLKYKFATIGTERVEISNNVTIKECIEHHSLLLGILSQFEDMYSTDMIHILTSDFILVSVSLFGILSNIDKSQISLCVAGIVATLFQFLCYCILGQLVQDQCESVAESAYCSNWSEIMDIKIRKALISSIQRSQKPMNMTMGRIFILSLQSFKQASQFIFSVVTLVVQSRE